MSPIPVRSLIVSPILERWPGLWPLAEGPPARVWPPPGVTGGEAKPEAVPARGIGLVIGGNVVQVPDLLSRLRPGVMPWLIALELTQGVEPDGRLALSPRQIAHLREIVDAADPIATILEMVAGSTP